MREWLASHASSDIPLLLLLVNQVAVFWFLYCAGKHPAGVIARMLHDETGKPSALRFASLSALNVASWALMTEVLKPGVVSWQIYLIYCAGTIGSHVAVKIGGNWDGKLPWAKGAP